MDEVYEKTGIPRPEFEIPEEITIEFGGLRLTTLRCDPEGIVLIRAGKERRYSWDEVEQVHIFLKDQNDLRFESVKLKLPDRSEPLTIRDGGFWTGPEPEVLTAFIAEHMESPPLNISVRFEGLRPRSVEEADRMLGSLEETASRPNLSETIYTLCVLIVALIIIPPLAGYGPFTLLHVMAAIVVAIIAVNQAKGTAKRAADIEKMRKLRDELAVREESGEGEEEAVGNEGE